VGAIISITGTNNANTLLSGQMPLAAARDGLFPARFNQLNSSDAPGFALVVSAVLASILIGLNYAKGLVAAFEFLILLATLTTLIPYAASAAADYVLHRRAVEQGTETRKWKTLIVAAIAFVFSIFAIIGSGLEVVAYGSLLLIAGLPVYYWTRKRTGVLLRG
jgi:APA family basic amino acid/polyamine antiporter